MDTVNNPPDFRRDATIVGLVGIAHAISHFFHLLIPPLFPWLIPAFGISFIEAGALMTAFFAVSGIGQALAGFAVDRFGTRPILLGGIAMLALAGLLLSASDSYLMLMAVAIIAGLGNSIFHPVDFSILNKKISQDRLGHAFSMHALSGNLGWAAAPLAMTSIASLAGWRMAALFAGLLAILVFALFYVQHSLFEEDPPKETQNETGDPITTKVSTYAILRSNAVYLCFIFFLLTTTASGALQNYSATTLSAMYEVSLTRAASCLSAYLFVAAFGILAGGFIVKWQSQEKIIAYCLSFGAFCSLILAFGLIPVWMIMPLMAIMGFGVGVAAPSRDLMVRKAITQNLGESSYGRVYGFAYSGMDVGLALAPLIFGLFLDHGIFRALWIGIAFFFGMAVITALQVEKRSSSN